MPDFKHSYSTMSTFETCPRQFQEKHVLKTIKFVQNEAATYGSEGHDVMDKSIKSKSLPEGRWSFAAPALQSVYNIAAQVEIQSEVAFGLKEDKTPDTFWNGWLRGKLDVLFKPSENRAIIADWKFAKFSPTKYDLEMDVFSYLVFKNDSSVQDIKRLLVWMKQDSPGKPTVSTVSRSKDFEQIEDKVLGKIAVIERSLETDNFPCKPGGLCKSYCDVLSCKFNGKNK